MLLEIQKEFFDFKHVEASWVKVIYFEKNVIIN